MKNRKTISVRPDQDGKIKTSRKIFQLTSLLFIGVVVYVLFFSDFLKITEFSVKGNSEISVGEIERAVIEEISGKYLGIFPKNNLLLFPGAGVEKRLKGEFEKIRSVKTKRKFPGTIFFEIDERKTPLVYFSKEKIFAVDENGVAYSEIPAEKFWGNEKEKAVLRSETGGEVDLGEEIFPAEYVFYVSNIGEEIKKELGIEVEKQIETPSGISGDLRVKTLEGWRIYFSAEIPLEREIDILEIFLEKSLKDIKRADLEYIDLRSENKIFYKLKNSEERKEEESKEEVKGEETKKAEDKKDKKKK